MESAVNIYEFKIGGMSCAACSAAVERAVKRLSFVDTATVNLSTERLRVRCTSRDTDAIVRAVEKMGFTASLLTDRKAMDALDRLNKAKERKKRLIRLVVSAVFGILLFALSMLHMAGAFPFIDTNPERVLFTVLQIVLLIPVIICGRDFYTRGFRAAVKLHPNMDTLVSLGTVAAVLYSCISLMRLLGGDESAVKDMYWDSAAVIITLVMLGKFFEAGSKDKTLDTIRALRDLTPDTAETIDPDGRQKFIAADGLMRGDVIVVRAGSRIPCDGIVLEGNGYVDESMITGESIPVFKQTGDNLSAGTLNTTGYMLLRADSVGEETSVSAMIRLVEDAQGSKAPVSRLADSIAAIFVPVVGIIALLASCAWLLAGAGFSVALNVFVSVLVVACPCSLGLATPTAIIVGTGIAAERGILIKNGEALERACKLTTVCFDKTGTLTEGKPAVMELIPYETDETHLLTLMASVEQNSEHPLGRAIAEYATSKSISPTAVSSFETIPGFGISAMIDDKPVLCGSRELLEQRDIPFPLETVDAICAKGQTVILAASEEKYIGLAGLADTVRTDARTTVQRLERMGIESVLITGDHASTAKAIAEEAAIPSVYSHVLPGEKSSIVKELKHNGRCVAMAGDGINDAPALASADIGFAVASGTDVAIASADIVLLGNRLSSVADAIDISGKTMRVIRQNLFWAFFYNCIGIAFAAGVLHLFGGPFLSPMICALAMSFSSVTVVSNALRLKSICKPVETEREARL